ncbi:MAG: competence/damage-inducible protein A [Chloroflexi bacterium]|nr:MAG: competence/damage-inducible protein A [Chloroflexota bacterium]
MVRGEDELPFGGGSAAAKKQSPFCTEIIAIGNELLIGEVQDTNTHWLCRQITGLGGFVARCLMVRDDPAEIASAIRSSLDRGARLIITTGGLGPTVDDLTLAAVADALGLHLRENPEALRMVEKRYRELYEAGFVESPEVTPARRKMASIPEGATPLANPVGTAPGILLRFGDAHIVCLPGVPEEMKGIFESSLTPFLKELFGRAFYRSVTLSVECGDESAIASIVDEIARAHPDVYIKSRVRAFGEEVRLKVTVAASGITKEEVEHRLQQTIAHLKEKLPIE